MSKKNEGITILSFLLSPILSFPFIIDLIGVKSKIGFFLFALLTSLLVSIYIPLPNEDLSRYYFHYQEVINLTGVNQFLFYLTKKTDIVYPMLMYFLSRMGFLFNAFIIITLTFTLQLYFQIFRDIVKEKKIPKAIILLLFFYYFTMIEITWTFGVLRNLVSYSLIVHSFYFGIIKRKLKADLIILLSPFVHFTSVFYVLIYFCSKYIIKKTEILKILFYISFIFIILPAGLVEMTINRVVPIISGEEVYVDKSEDYSGSSNDKMSEYVKEQDSKLSVVGRVSGFLKGTIPTLVMIGLTIFSKIKFDSFYYMIFILYNISNEYYWLNFRVLILLKILFAVHFIITYSSGYIKGSIYQAYIFYYVFITIFFFSYTHMDTFINSYLGINTFYLIGILMQNTYNLL